MKTVINFTINLMGKKLDLILSFDIFGFSVENNKGTIITGGNFGYRNRVYFTEHTAMVELFAEELEDKVIKLMKREKEAWKEVQNYQNNKKW